MDSFTTTVQEIGDDLGIVLDKHLCDRIGITCGSTVKIVNCGGFLQVIPVSEVSKPRIGIASGETLVTDDWFTEEADAEIASLFLGPHQ